GGGRPRVFARLAAGGLIPRARRSPGDVLAVAPADERRREAAATAGRLRGRGLKVETYHQADKLAKQIRYAARKGIPYVWFPPFEDGRPHEVKDLASGAQAAADPQSWRPAP